MNDELKQFIVLDYGCIECGEPTTWMGEADTVQNALLIAKNHKQHSYLIVDVCNKVVLDDWE